MKKAFANFLFLLIILLGIYAFLNIINLIWHILLPDGFWGYSWYYTITIITLTSIVYFFIFIAETIKEWKNKEFWIMIPIALLIMIPGIFFELGPQLLFQKRLNDRYEYIYQTDKYISEGRYNEAMEYAEKVYQKSTDTLTNPFFILSVLYEKSNYATNKRQSDIFNATLNYALCYEMIGSDLNSAKLYYNKSIQLADKYYAEIPELRLYPIMGQIRIYSSEKKYDKVEKLYRNLFDIIQTIKESDDVDLVVTSLISYAQYNSTYGDFTRSLKLYTKALSLYESSDYSKESKEFLSLLLLTANAYMANNQAEKAYELIKKADEIAEDFENKQIFIAYLTVKVKVLIAKSNTAIDDQNYDSKGAVDMLLNWYYEVEPSKQELNEEIGEVLEEIAEETKDRQGSNHLSYALKLNDLSLFYYRNRSLNIAAKYSKESLKIASKYKYTYRDVFYSIYLSSAYIDYSLGKISSVYEKFQDFENYQLEQINERMPFLTEEDREAFLILNSRGFGLINSIYCTENNPEGNIRLYNNMLSLKGIALQSNQYLRKSILNSKDDNLSEQFDEVLKSKNRLNKTDILSELEKAQLQDSIRQLEKDIYQQVISKPKYKKFLSNSIKWEAVRNSLSDSDVIVSYINVPNQENPNVTDYYAMVLNSKSKTPELFFIGDEKEISNLIGVEGVVDIQINQIYGGKNRDALISLLWEPINKSVENYRRVYISVDGILNTVSFPGLLIDRGKELFFITSPRVIVGISEKGVRQDSNVAILYGGIEYSTNNELVGAETTNKNSVRGKVIQNEYNPLPFTKEEVRSIDTILKSNNYSTILFTGDRATEQSFRDLSNDSISIIHVATHGFYVVDGVNSTYQDKLNISNPNYGNNPLTRTGLIFSGYLQRTDDSHNDGLLNALEISELDLSNVDLVVLSACETGLGEIKGGEGVYGLQRGFKLAGVNSIIISLWSVPDRQTSMLMKKFYEYYTAGCSKQSSLLKAQLDIKKDYPEPFYWAAFIVIE